MNLNKSLTKKIENIDNLTYDFENIHNQTTDFEKMNLKKSLIIKIESISKQSDEFDKIFLQLLQINEKDKLSEKTIENVYTLTKLYIFTRSEHGSILLLFDKFKKTICEKSTELNDALINKMYDVSAFYSIIENISILISNIDFQFKKIALKYPKYINNRPLIILLFVDNIKTNKLMINIIEELRVLKPENIYKIIECDPGNKIKCDSILGKNIDIKVDQVPSLFIVNNNFLSEIPIEHVKKVNDLVNLIN